MSDESTWVAKQEWAKRLRQSRLTPPVKFFGWVVFEFAHGDKMDCWPSTAALVEAGGYSSHSGFKKYRDALVECGALTAELDRHTDSGRGWENYLYTINLNWDGSVPEHLQPKARGFKPKPRPQITTAGKSAYQIGKELLAQGQPDEPTEPAQTQHEPADEPQEPEQHPEAPGQPNGSEKPSKPPLGSVSGWAAEEVRPPATVEAKSAKPPTTPRHPTPEELAVFNAEFRAQREAERNAPAPEPEPGLIGGW